MPSLTRDVACASAASAVQPSMDGPSDPAAVPKPVTKWSISHSESKLLSPSNSCQTSRRSGQEMPAWVAAVPNLMPAICFLLTMCPHPPALSSDKGRGENAGVVGLVKQH